MGVRFHSEAPMLMRCARCSHAFLFREGQRFCTGCAAPVTVPCGQCGKDGLPGDRFCGFCGGATAEPAALLPPAAPAAVSEELAGLVEAARARARLVAAMPAPPTKAHLSQADVDSLFG
jgi:predicted amidophosphoribosyltransferase